MHGGGTSSASARGAVCHSRSPRHRAVHCRTAWRIGARRARTAPLRDAAAPPRSDGRHWRCERGLWVWLTLLQMEDSDQSELTLWQSKATAEARVAGSETKASGTTRSSILVRLLSSRPGVRPE